MLLQPYNESQRDVLPASASEKAKARLKQPGRGMLVLENSILALASSFRFLLALDTGLFVMLAFSHLSQDACTGTLALESSQSALQGFVFPNTDFRHLYPSPPLISRPTGRTRDIILLFRPHVNNKFVIRRVFSEHSQILSSSFRPALRRPADEYADAARSGTRRARSWTRCDSRTCPAPAARQCARLREAAPPAAPRACRRPR